MFAKAISASEKTVTAETLENQPSPSKGKLRGLKLKLDVPVEALNNESAHVASSNALSQFLQSHNLKLKSPIGRGSFGNIHVLNADQVNPLSPFVNSLKKTFTEKTILVKSFKHETDYELRSPIQSRPMGEQLAALASAQSDYVPKALAVYRDKSTHQVTCQPPVQDQNFEQIGLFIEKGGTNLDDFLKTQVLNGQEKGKLALAILKAIESIHKLGIVHKDIKPGNLLVKRTEKGDFHVQVIDFGLSKQIGNGNAIVSPNKVGTIIYSAPEIFKKPRRYTMKVDAWSVGLVLWKVFEGSDLFKDAFHDGHVQHKKRGQGKLILNFVNTPITYQVLLKSFLNKTPENRCSLPSAIKFIMTRPLPGSSASSPASTTDSTSLKSSSDSEDA